jgi:urea transport system substrate-binding protein
MSAFSREKFSVARNNQSDQILENEPLSVSTNQSSSSEQNRSSQPAAADQTGVTGEGKQDTSISAEFVTERKGIASAGAALIGQTLGRYRMIEVLGTGGMGIVYKAHDEIIERNVAIKVLPCELSSNERALPRFLSEARAAGKLTHPNTVAIHEVGEAAGTYYLVMELVSGGSVADLLQKTSRISVLDATRIIADAARGLSAAHDVGLVHRDIKPSNLLMTETGSVKVADFGLVKAALEDRGVTHTGQVLGTPYFMSPEQCESKPVDGRSDIYSLGATYYTLLTGLHPFHESNTTVQILYAHCHAEPLDPRKVDATIPEACASIVKRATAKKPAERYQTMTEMLADLESVIATLFGAAGITLLSQTSVHRLPAAVQTTRSSRSPPDWGVAGGVIAAALIAFLAVWFFYRAGEKRGPDVSPGSAGTPQANGEPAPTGAPIKVGVLHSLRGTMAGSESCVVDATLLAIEEINAAGGLLGRPVVPVIADGRSDWPTFEREAKRLIEQEHVCTVFGCWTSASRKKVIPVFEEHDHLLIYPVQYEGLEQSRCVVYTGAAPNQQLIPAMKWAFAFGNKRRFFLVGSDYVFPRAANAIMKDQLKELGGEVVGEEYVPLGSTRLDAVVERIAMAKPDVILNTINGDTNLVFFKALRAAGVKAGKVPTISFSIGEEELRHLDVASTVGDFAAWNYFQSVQTPENERFVKRFRERYGPTRVLTDPMEAAYFGVKLWAKAVQRAGSIKPKSIREALHGQRLQAPEGEVRIDPVTQHTYKTPRIGQMQPDGQFEIVWTGAKPEAPEPFPKTRSRDAWKALLDDLQKRWNGDWSAPTNGR